MSYNTFNQRFRKIVEWINQPNNTLAGERLGINRQDVENYLNDKGPSYPKLVSILESMPEIRTEWLVLGIGEMLKDGNEIKVEEAQAGYQRMDIHLIQKRWEEDRRELTRLRELTQDLTQQLISVRECGNKSKTA
jgi:hypothetical protein